MRYRAVGLRCAADIEDLDLSVTKDDALGILRKKGFIVMHVDLIALARSRVGKSAYRRGAKLREAPTVFDCSSFTKWLYGKRGIWLPRRSIQQHLIGESIQSPEIMAGDLIFTSGHAGYYIDNPADGIGHVGIATGEDNVVHAANKHAGVIESSLVAFTAANMFRGARRIIPKGRKVLTLLTPPEREVETSDDIRWIILQTLPKGEVC